MDPDEDPRVCALRELEEECCIKGRDAKLICVKGEKDRDPRGPVVTCAYYVKVDENAEVKAADDASAAEWYPLD